MATGIDLSALERAMHSLPQRFKGPGGLAGVVENGKVLATQAWGYADIASGRAMTRATRMPICSISKQFTCAALLDLVDDPSFLDNRVADFLPLLEGRMPCVADLCNMQSGLRDYWALTVLHGAHTDGVFRRDDAKPLLARMRTTHFNPGTSYSYSNGNFRILSDVLEAHADRPLAELYAKRIFEPAGMLTALFTPDTSMPADGVIGYEGTEGIGFFPASNRIYWSGDAGISASLDDMLAWECHIDATRDDAGGLYRRLSRMPAFSDGTPARYGYGLAHETIGDIAVTGHGGALRGFRCQRLYAPSKRLSVVVLFNHQANAHEAARGLMQSILGQGEAGSGVDPVASDWNGDYLDAANGLLLGIEVDGAALNTHYGTSPERIHVGANGIASSSSMTLSRDGNAIQLVRPGENLKAVATRIAGQGGEGLEGRYFSRETDGFLDIAATGAVLFGRFEGLLGTGPMHAIHPVGDDVFVLSCQRSMDAPAPGRWTVQVERNDAGDVCGLVLGCWLARNLMYRKIS